MHFNKEYNNYVKNNVVLTAFISIAVIMSFIIGGFARGTRQDTTPQIDTYAQNACVQGDTNGDGKVTLSDFEVWRRIYKAGGATTPVPTVPITIVPTIDAPQVTVLAENLNAAWALVYLPGGSLLVTERPGRVRLIENGQLQPAPVATLTNVAAIEEGGLMGMDLHPQFATNGFVYLMYTYGNNNTNTQNRVVRMKYANKQLTEETTIVDAIPATAIHKGGRIKFGPDGFLYITAGDTSVPSLAQDTNSLAGKILRVTDTGAPAPGNPFGTRIYSYGHRNPQGIAWDAQGNLWETEHGETALDEFNLITPGANYGWPTIRGDQEQTGMKRPVLHSAQDTWAPAGMTIMGSSAYFGGLRGVALYQVTLPGGTNLRAHFKDVYGRIRDVIKAPDGMLYMSTSNLGHAPRPNDDKVFRVNPGKL